MEKPFPGPGGARAVLMLAATALLGLACGESGGSGAPAGPPATPEEAAVREVIATLDAANEAKVRIALAPGDSTKALEAALRERPYDLRVLNDWGGPARAQYYCNQVIPELRRYGALWLVFDHRDQLVADTFRDFLTQDHRIEVEKTSLHFRLLRLTNEFSSAGVADNKVHLVEVARASGMPCDLQFLPGSPRTMFIAAKHGDVQWVSLDEPAKLGYVLTLPQHDGKKAGVFSAGESGVIGLAFHPGFAENRKLYVCYTYIHANREKVLRVSEWTLDLSGPPKAVPDSERILLSIPKENDNHNGGQIVFGPDGFLYMAVGDGEEGEWTKGRSPAHTLRGKVLRIDVDSTTGDKQYGIPADNPFVDHATIPPETWAWGFRNPWRISFTPDGRLIAGDVGANEREEVTFVKRGRHHGWPFFEGSLVRNEWVHGDAPQEPPLFEFGRDLGMSVIGGHVYTGSSIDWLRGRYVFVDHLSGWMFALDLPAPEAETRTLPAAEVRRIGRWPSLFTTFGRGPDGELYVAVTSGQIYRLDGKPGASLEGGGGGGGLDPAALRAMFRSDPPAPERAAASGAEVALGQQLYSEPRLTAGGNVSCATCHDLGKYGQDGKPAAPGGRNVPSSFNAHRQFAQMWDYRLETVERAVMPPAAGARAHGIDDPDRAVQVLRGIPEYAAAFAKAYPDAEQPITAERVRLALGAFLRALETRSPWDAYLDGDDDALSADARRGVSTFVEVGCTACHLYRLVGGHMGQKLGLVQPRPGADKGHAEVSGNQGHEYFFKVPQLLNVARTAPYYHDGSIATLDEAVRDMAIVQLNRQLTDDQVRVIVAFLEALTGDAPAILR